MPIDASIPLQVRPPQVNVPDPVEQYGRMMSLRHMQAQEQERQQLAPLVMQQHQADVQARQAQATQQQIQLQQMQQDQKDDEIGQKAYNDAQGNVGKYQELARHYGMSTRGMARAQANIDAHSKALAEKTRLDTDADLKLHELNVKRHDDLHDRLNAFLQRPEDDSTAGQKTNWKGFLDAARRDKLMTDEEYSETIQHYKDYPGRAAAEQMRNSLKTDAILQRERKAAADQAKASADYANLQKTRQANSEALRSSTLNRLANTTDPAAFDRVATDSNLAPELIGGDAYQYFDQDGNPVADKMRSLSRMALSPEKRAAAEAADAKAKQVAADADERKRHNTQTEGYQSRMAGASEKRAANGPAGNRTTAVRNSAESAIKAAGNVDDAITAFQRDHSDDSNFGDVMKELRGIKAGGTREANAEETLKKKDALGGLEKAKWMKDHPDEPIPTKTEYDRRMKADAGKRDGGRGGAAPPTPARTPAPPATPPPAPTPAANTSRAAAGPASGRTTSARDAAEATIRAAGNNIDEAFTAFQRDHAGDANFGDVMEELRRIKTGRPPREATPAADPAQKDTPPPAAAAGKGQKPGGQPIRLTLEGKQWVFPDQQSFDAFKKDNPQYSWDGKPAQRRVRVTIPGHGEQIFPSEEAFEQFKKDHPEFTWK